MPLRLMRGCSNYRSSIPHRVEAHLLRHHAHHHQKLLGHLPVFLCLWLLRQRLHPRVTSSSRPDGIRSSLFSFEPLMVQASAIGALQERVVIATQLAIVETSGSLHFVPQVKVVACLRGKNTPRRMKLIRRLRLINQQAKGLLACPPRFQFVCVKRYEPEVAVLETLQHDCSLMGGQFLAKRHFHLTVQSEFEP